MREHGPERPIALRLIARPINPLLGEALFISPHTARHHTEAVLGALGASSRREVAERAGERP